MPKKGENIYKRKDGRWEGRYIRLRNMNRFFAKMAQNQWRENGAIRPRAIFAKCQMRETASGGAVGYYTALVTHDMAVAQALGSVF